MKRATKFANLLLLTLLLINYGCSKEEIVEILSLQDLVVTIDENPTVGQIIGTIQTNGVGTTNFSITSETPAGAISIDANTGELTVADVTLFDFETNPVITAIVSANEATNTAAITINLNDLTNDNFPTNELKSFYKLNNTTNDSGPNNYDAIANNVIYEADRNNNANSVAAFNGLDAFVEFPNASRFEPLMSSTLAFWIKTDQQSRFDLFDQRTGSLIADAYNFGIIINQVNTDDVSYSYPNYAPSNATAYMANSITISDGSWHHLVFIKDTENDVMKLYIDNVEEVNIPIVQDYSFMVNGTLLLGKNYISSNYFEGSIDDIFIYDRAISANEVGTLFTYAD